MPETRKSWRRSFSLLRWAALGVTLCVAAACADNRALIDRTLDRRAVALNTKDLKLYVSLLAPDYVKADPNFDPAASMKKLFGSLTSIHYQAFSRNVEFEGPDLARINQDYRIVIANEAGQTRTVSGVDHFMMKSYGTWPFKKWLIHQGLDAKAQPPAATTPEASPGGTP